MSKFTRAYSNYIRRLVEIIELKRLANSYSRKMVPTSKNLNIVNALCRGAVVLLASHIEGYVEDLGELSLDCIVSKKMIKSDLSNSFFYYFSKDIIDEIKDTGNPSAISTKMKEIISRDGDIWDNNITFVNPLPSDRFLHSFSNPKIKEIKKFFSRFGYTQYLHDMAILLRGNYIFCKNMIDTVMEIRHKIAHGKLVTVDPIDIEDMIRLVSIFCRSTDIVVANWFKNKGCTIR